MAAERILIVDDEEAIREVVCAMLHTQGYHCTPVSNGYEALAQLRANSHDLVLSDVVMPRMPGHQLLERIHRHDKDIPVIMVSAIHDVSTAIEAIRMGAYDYILKPFEKEQLFVSVRRALEHRRLVLENQNYQRNLEKIVSERTAQLSQAFRDLEDSYDYTLEALGGALDLKDSETEGHCERVTAITITIAKTMNIGAIALRQIARGAFLHDIGKMGIPDQILRKPGPLTDDEREVMRRHCEIGYAVLERIPFLREAAQIVLTHQEHYDGSGYPLGLKGEKIPLGSRIFAVADALDAITSNRPYRKALPFSVAVEEIKRCAGTQFDPQVVEVFLSIRHEFWSELRESIGDPLRLAMLQTS